MAADDDPTPVVSGLLALLSVGLVLGIAMGGAFLVVKQIKGNGDSTSTASSGPTLYLPSPLPGVAVGGSVAASGIPSGDGGGIDGTGPNSASSGSSGNSTGIFLEMSPLAVSVNARIAVDGNYPGGEGEIIQVQYLDGGTWKDFGVPGVAVVGGKYSTSVQVSTAGTVSFRAYDKAKDVSSNNVKVTVK